MYRYLAFVIVIATVAFFLQANVAQEGHVSYLWLERFATVFLVGGVLLTMLSVIGRLRGRFDQQRRYEEFAVAGMIASAYGVSTFPFTHEKVLVLPIVLCMSAAVAMIVGPMSAPHPGPRHLPIAISMIAGPLSVWALAAGWSMYLATIVLFVGSGLAFATASMRPAYQPTNVVV